MDDLLAIATNTDSARLALACVTLLEEGAKH